MSSFPLNNVSQFIYKHSAIENEAGKIYLDPRIIAFFSVVIIAIYFLNRHRVQAALFIKKN